MIDLSGPAVCSIKGSSTQLMSNAVSATRILSFLPASRVNSTVARLLLPAAAATTDRGAFLLEFEWHVAPVKHGSLGFFSIQKGG